MREFLIVFTIFLILFLLLPWLGKLYGAYWYWVFSMKAL